LLKETGGDCVRLHITVVFNKGASSVESRELATLRRSNDQKNGGTDDFLMPGQSQQMWMRHFLRATWPEKPFYQIRVV
jgi:hypothetical protein